MSKVLANRLQDIAQGNNFNSDALYQALEHPVTTINDKQMIHRYLHGAELGTDRFKLQQLALEIFHY